MAVTVAVIIAAAGASDHADSSGSPSAGSLPSFSSLAGLPQSVSKARMGSAVTLGGMYTGEQMSVTVTKVVSTASPAGQFSAPPAGDRLYAVQFRLDDTGTAAFSDDLSSEAVVVDSAGQSYPPAVGTAANCLAFPASEVIAAGDNGLGCVTFDVPATAKIVAAQFTLDSGAGPQTGQWALPT